MTSVGESLILLLSNAPLRRRVRIIQFLTSPEIEFLRQLGLREGLEIVVLEKRPERYNIPTILRIQTIEGYIIDLTEQQASSVLVEMKEESIFRRPDFWTPIWPLPFWQRGLV